MPHTPEVLTNYSGFQLKTFGIGMRHDDFFFFEGSGADARVQVKFRNAVAKWLALEYTKLTST